MFDRLGERPALTVALLGLLTAAGAVVAAVLTGVPLPSVHDEFSYLLQADTFTEGRLTNPSPPLWQHFETLHVIMQPTYASKYPPGQGLALALGQLLGHPVIGVWLSVGLMVSATTWMLFAWLPPRWAVIAGMVAALHIGIGSYWAHSYWGGAVAATGGALVYGALRRAAEEPTVRTGWLLGLGFSLLAVTRPFEGFLVSFPVAAILLYWLMRGSDDRGRILVRTMLPAAAAVAATVAFLGYYNWRVTGDPLTWPYMAYQEQYAIGSGLLSFEIGALPDYRHAAIERYYQIWGLERLQSYQDPIGFVGQSLFKIARNLCFYLGPGLIALLFLRRAARDRWILFAALVSVGLVIASLATMGTYPHYWAPITGLLFVMMGASLAAMHRSRGSARAGTRRTMLVLIAFGLYFVSGYEPLRTSQRFAVQRSEVRETLSQRPGSDLVIVRYGPDHSVHQEWVYNAADLEEADIVWARDMGPSANRRLVTEYSNRRVWLLRVRDGTINLQKYQWDSSTEARPTSGSS